MAASPDRLLGSTQYLTNNQDSDRRGSVPILSMPSDRQRSQSVERSFSQQETYSSEHQYQTRDDWASRRDTNIHSHSRASQLRRSSPYYIEQQEDCRYTQHHDSYYGENEPEYRNSSHHYLNGYNDHVPYSISNTGSFEEHYSANVMMRSEHMAENGNIRLDSANQNNHNSNTLHHSTIASNNGILMGKHRNNSISSNTSSNNSSSCSVNKHPCKFPTCGWSFKRFEHLKRHMLVHTKERPFVCEFQGCEKSFSRSDNFSAHLRTHTKKSIHMRKPDRHMMGPIGFMPMGMGDGHITGSNTTVRAPSYGAEAGMTTPGGMMNSSHSGMASPRSSPGSTQIDAASNGGTPVHVNSRRAPSHCLRATSADYHKRAEYETSPSTPTSLSHSSLDSQYRRQYHHQRSQSSSDVHPYDARSATANSLVKPEPRSSSPKSVYAGSAISEMESTKSALVLATSKASSKNNSNNVDNKNVPTFNAIKLDIKAVSNNPDDVQLHNQHNLMMESFHAQAAEHERDFDHYRGSPGRRKPVHRPFDADQHNRHHPILRPRSLSPPSSLSSRWEPNVNDHHYHDQHGLTLYEAGHNGPNPNPNGESPTQPNRATLSNNNMSMPFASHFVPSNEMSDRRNGGYGSMMHSEGEEDIDYDGADRLSRDQKKSGDKADFYKPTHHLSHGIYESVPSFQLPARSHPDGRMDSVPISMDEDEDPMRSPARDWHIAEGYSGPSSYPDYPHHRHSFSEYKVDHSSVADSRSHAGPMMSPNRMHVSLSSSSLSSLTLPSPGSQQQQNRYQHHHRSQSEQYYSTYPHHIPLSMQTSMVPSNNQHSMMMGVGESEAVAVMMPGVHPGRMRGSASSAKNHCCSVPGCMKRFKRLEHLKRHIKTHTLERPFACTMPGCNKRFSRSDNLSQHTKTHQRQIMNKSHWKQRASLSSMSSMFE